jgi:predicted DNA-binding protein
MKSFHVATKIPSAHYTDLLSIQNATGQTQSEILREAIAVYLKKTKVPIIKSRLDALEEKVNKLAALIVK